MREDRQETEQQINQDRPEDISSQHYGGSTRCPERCTWASPNSPPSTRTQQGLSRSGQARYACTGDWLARVLEAFPVQYLRPTGGANWIDSRDCLHLSAFAAGEIAVGLIGDWVARVLGRWATLWTGAGALALLTWPRNS
jgi:hypothetical protein